MKSFIYLIILSLIGLITSIIIISFYNKETGSYIMFLSLSVFIISCISVIFKIIENYDKNQN